MKFYHIKETYIEFLRNYDTKVAENKRESRPYVGVVVEISGIKYYAPFTSPKPKHLKMKNGKDFRKIQGGQYGAINFNNMIPVPDPALLLFDFSTVTDMKYKRLLQNQYNAIQADSTAIENTAAKLRSLVFTEDENLSAFDQGIKARCCDLKTLEAVYLSYQEK